MILCNWCDEMVPEPPQEAYATSDPQPVYCDERCELQMKYHNRRERFGEPKWWQHPCPECGRAMFTPREIDGKCWWCPECDKTEDIDTTGLAYLREKSIFGDRLRDFEHECPNPECDSWVWLFDGMLSCHECDVAFPQWGRQWWAMIEEEYPPTYSSWNKKSNTTQTEL